MALQTPSQTTSYDQSGTYKLSLEDMISQVYLDDHELLKRVGMDSSMPATQTKHEWDEDVLNPVTVAANATGGLTTASATLMLDANQASRVTAGTLLKDQLSGKYEVLQVTALATNSATVTRGYGGTSAEAHAASATYDIIANPRPEGMEGPKDESVARTREYNFTQIFSKGVKLTGTAQAIAHNGLSDEAAYQVQARLKELMRELDRALLMGIRSATRHSDTVYGTMGGVIDYVKHATNGNTNSTAEFISPSVINQMAQDVYDDGGEPDTIVVGAAQKRKISSFDQEYRRSTMDSRRAGFYIEEFVSDLGRNLRVVLDRWMPSDACLVIDSSKISVVPLQGRGFFLEPLAKTGDSDKWQIVGEYTAVIKNAAQCHAFHWNLKQ